MDNQKRDLVPVGGPLGICRRSSDEMARYVPDWNWMRADVWEQVRKYQAPLPPEGDPGFLAAMESALAIHRAAVWELTLISRRDHRNRVRVISLLGDPAHLERWSIWMRLARPFVVAWAHTLNVCERMVSRGRKHAEA